MYNISMAMKSGKLIFGFNNIKQKVSLYDIFLIMVCKDVSHKTIKELIFISKDKGINICYLDFKIDEIHFLLGKKAGIIGLVDKGFALNLSKYLKPINT